LLLRLKNPNPLKQAPDLLPSIDVLIPVAGKDIKHLDLVLSNLKKYCQNPISSIYIVTPDIGAVNLEFSDNIKACR
jgi:hypothetical protein